MRRSRPDAPTAPAVAMPTEHDRPRSSEGGDAPRRPRLREERADMDNPVWVWGLPIAPMTRLQTVEAVVELVEAGQPTFFITANAHYAMLTHEAPGLRDINEQAA